MPHRREFGLERFVPSSLLEGMKRKEIRRLMAHFLKLNSQMTGSSKMLTQLQVSRCIPLAGAQSYLAANEKLICSAACAGVSIRLWEIHCEPNGFIEIRKDGIGAFNTNSQN